MKLNEKQFVMSNLFLKQEEDLTKKIFNIFLKILLIQDPELCNEIVETNLKNVDNLLIVYEEYLKLFPYKLDLNNKDDFNRFKISEFKLEILKDKYRKIKQYIKNSDEKKITAFRLKNLTSINDKKEKSSIEYKTHNQKKNELFSQKKSETEDVEKLNIKDEILKHNKNIIISLKSTRQLMSTSIFHSELNIENLDQQTKDLHNLNDDYILLYSIFTQSKSLIKFIEKQDVKSKRRIYLSMTFFFICCGWVTWRRLFKRIFKILTWSLIKFTSIVVYFFYNYKKISEIKKKSAHLKFVYPDTLKNNFENSNKINITTLTEFSNSGFMKNEL